MMKFVALLRGVNVGGHKKVGMADLTAMADDLGLKGARTLLQSGNLLFEAALKPLEIERDLEAASSERLGAAVTFVVRSLDDLARVLEQNPFRAAAADDPSHLLVMFFKAAPSQEGFVALKAAVQGRERLELQGRELYIVYPDGIGNSKLTHARIERKLGAIGTARNFNTLLKLVGASSSAGAI
jgi:uncharacterized protein (DUF1697 family)